MPRVDIGGATNRLKHVKMEEKRAKREIANMNERRRMQNINAGFHSLRALLPQKHDGEKLSKAAILQHTATYIYQLEQEITKLLTINSELKRCVGSGSTPSQVNTPEWVKRFASQPPDCPSCKRRKYENNHRLDIDSSPIGDGSSTESSSEQEMNSKLRAKNRSNGNKNSDNTLRKQLSRVEKQLEEERRLRSMLEEEFSYQGKSITVNGRPYHATADPHDEVEVASESIEIEMHSCPASPPDVSIPAAEHVTNSVFHTSQYSRIELAHPNKILEQTSNHRIQKQNAIALPIDMPFVAPSEIETSNTIKSTNNSTAPLMVLVDNNGVVSLIDSTKLHANSSSIIDSSGGGGTTQPQILQIVQGGPNSKLITTTRNATNLLKTSPDTASKTSRQNLNKLVEAIRHLEGDHLFNESSAAAAAANLNLKQELLDDKDHTDNNIIHRDMKVDHDNISSITTTTSNDPNVILNNMVEATTNTTLTNGSDNVPRPQIIQRPNVIVATSMEN